MKDFNTWLNESVLPNIQQAIDILKDHKDRKDLVRRIQLADPYPDKRFAPVIAYWILDHGITPEEHRDDITLFKALHRRLKDLRVPANNRERSEAVKELLAWQPQDFDRHYSTLGSWNREVSNILDPERDLSDDGLPVEMRYNDYTMYRIDSSKHLDIPLVANSMSWCVTKDSFGKYGGPPYYPIMRDRDRSPFAMIIPAYFDTDPDQAVRNADNDGRLSNQDLAKIRPLVQRALPLDEHEHPYIKGIHGLKPEMPDNPSAKLAFDIIRDYTLEPGAWPEGERAIAGSGWALEYAVNILKGPFPAGERTIAQSAYGAVRYAIYALRGPFPAGEENISEVPELSYDYAVNVKGRFQLGEPGIAADPELALGYALHVLKGPFPLGEPAINKSREYKTVYDQFLKKLGKQP